MQLPKIKIGRRTKREYFDMSHDVNTTCDFGFCQPTLMQDLIPNTKFKLSTRGFVRLSPMPVPTFGRMKVKTVTRCIDILDVFPDFKHFLAKRQILNSSMLTPQNLVQCDYVYLSQILAVMQSIQYNNVFHGGTTYADYENVDPNDVLFRLSLHTNAPMKEGQVITPVGGFAGYFYNVFDSFDGTPGMGNTAYNQLKALLESGVLNTTSIFGKWKSSRALYELRSDINDYATGASDVLRTSLLQWLTNNQDVHSFPAHQDPSALLGSYDQYNLTSGGINLPANLKHLFDSPLTIDNADFIFDYGSLNVPYVLVKSDSSSETQTITACKVGLHFTPAGRRLFKILFAIGLDTSTKDYKLPLYKFFAYYKAWFDTFNIGRLYSWENTVCHSLIDRFHEAPFRPLSNCFNPYQTDGYADYGLPLENFSEFLRHLVRCCYVMDADPYTCCTDKPLLDLTQNDMLASSINLPLDTANNTEGYNSLHVVQDANSQYGKVASNYSSALPFNSLTIHALQMVYPFLNKSSRLANKVNEILRVRYGVDLPTTDFVGEQEFDINVQDVFSTAETSEGTLGEYAGKAVGGIGSKDKPAKQFSYETSADTFSFLVQFTCIVPYGGYSQSTPKHSINVADWYSQEYDSMGMEPVSRSQVLGRTYCTKFVEDSPSLFGFRPQFMRYKYHDNLANGGFAFRSQLGYFMPYMLDRYFTPSDCESYKDASSQYPGTTFIRDNQSVLLTPSEELRFIGLNESYGNYDRIFYDNAGTSDNFILTLYQDFDMYSCMRSISESYDTYDPERDDDTIKTSVS